ncbi:MAG: L-histidine N(alpha)-methyltransferase [Candidatus Woesearchaeota archaeon]|nr:L-histidine N(alpha)-methyltransferase [Candidatus Woesearchaeota archaeon]
MFTKRQEAELITSIQGRGEIPLKFAYLGEGAVKWHTIAKKRSSGGINYAETQLLSRKIRDFISSFTNAKKINLIDIGCGDGQPVLPILKELSSQDISFRYVPIDISKEMLDLAEKTILSKHKGCEVKKYLIDFELGNFSDITYDLKSDGSANLLLFLGSTLGNFSDRNRILTNIRDSMSSDDFLIVGVEMTNFSKVNKLLPHYTGKEALDFVFTVPVNIGIKVRTVEYEAVWNEKDTQIEIWIQLKNDQKIHIGSDSFTLERDERLLLGRSVKFNEWTFTKLMSDVGFRTELLTTSKDREYVLSMVQPTRYAV